MIEIGHLLTGHATLAIVNREGSLAGRWMAGVEETARVSLEHHGGGVCPPSPTTVKELVRIFTIHTLRERTQLEQRPAVEVVLDALEAAYPCQPTD